MMLLRSAWRNIWRNKRRTWITISSIAFAVFFASLTQSMQLGSYNRMIDNAVRFMTGHLAIHQTDYWEERILDNSFSDAELEQVRIDSSKIAATSPRLSSFALASYEEKTKGALLNGVILTKEAQFSYLDQKLVAGNYETKTGVLIAEGLAAYLETKIGDTIVFISQGYHGINAAAKYPISGILKFPVPELNRSAVYMPLAAAQDFYGADGLITSNAILLNDAREVDQVVVEIALQSNVGLEVQTWKTMMPELVQGIEMDYYGGLMMIFILYAIIGFGIFGTFLMMTRERNYEFGILTAIGMKKVKIQLMVALEILLLTFLGVLVGLLISTPIIFYLYLNPIVITGDAAAAFENFGYEPIIPFSMEGTIFYNQGIVIFIISLFLGLYPMWFIRQLKTVKALKS